MRTVAGQRSHRDRGSAENQEEKIVANRGYSIQTVLRERLSKNHLWKNRFPLDLFLSTMSH